MAKGIDKEQELVIIWVSPKARAQQTAGIIKTILEKEGALILEKGWKGEKTIKEPLRITKPLKDVTMTPKFIQELIKAEATGDWMRYWTESEKLPEGVETPEEVKTRTKRLITYLERIARSIKSPEGKKLHFICVGHEEIVRDLLEEAYGLGTEKGTGPDYGEVLRMNINKSSVERDATLNLKYRNLDSRLGFNIKERNFYRIKK